MRGEGERARLETGLGQSVMIILLFAREESRMFILRSSLGICLLLIASVACFAQDKTTAAIKGKVRVEKGSPSGVSVMLMQGDNEISQSTTNGRGDFVLSRVN